MATYVLLVDVNYFKSIVYIINIIINSVYNQYNNQYNNQY